MQSFPGTPSPDTIQKYMNGSITYGGREAKLSTLKDAFFAVDIISVFTGTWCSTIISLNLRSVALASFLVIEASYRAVQLLQAVKHRSISQKMHTPLEVSI